MDRINLEKISSVILILGPIYFIIVEFISILYSNVNVINAYAFHTISELGVPIGSIYKGMISTYSPMFMIMNSAFIIVGLTLIIGISFSLQKYISKNNFLVDLFAIIASIGVILVGIFHATDGLLGVFHLIAALMIILGGNLLLIFVSKYVNLNDNYEKISKYLGIFGLIAIVIMLIFRFSYLQDYQAIFERCAVYPLVLWSFITGFYSFRNSFY